MDITLLLYISVIFFDNGDFCVNCKSYLRAGLSICGSIYFRSVEVGNGNSILYNVGLNLL